MSTVDQYFAEMSGANESIQAIHEDYNVSVHEVRSKAGLGEILPRIDAWRKSLVEVSDHMKSLNPSYEYLGAEALPPAAPPPVRRVWQRSGPEEKNKQTEIRNVTDGSVVVSEVPDGTLVLEALTDCLIIVPVALNSLIGKNLKNCHIHLKEVKRSLLIYGIADSTLSVMNVSQSRIHDAYDLKLYMASTKRPIFEASQRVTLFPPLLRTLKTAEPGQPSEINASGECIPSEALEPIFPVDFSTQLQGGHSLTWGVPKGFEFEPLDLIVSDEVSSLKSRPEWGATLKEAFEDPPAEDLVKAALDMELDLEEF